MELGRPRGGTSKAVPIDRMPIARMWFALLHQRFTGIVQIDQPDPPGSRTVWVEGGMPIYTDWLSPAVLGEVLIEAGSLTTADLGQALAVMAREGGLLGQVLLRLNLIQPAALTDGLRRQCMRKLLSTFQLRSGEALVTAGAFETPAGIAKVNVLEMISLGITAHYDLARIDHEMGPALQGPVSATMALQRYLANFRFRPSDDPAIAALRGPTSLETLARLPGLTRTRAAQLLYTLYVSQMLHVGAAAEVAAQAAPPPADPRHTPTHVPAPATERRSTTPPTPPVAPRRATPTDTSREIPSASSTTRGRVAAEPVEESDGLGPEEFIAALVAMEAKIAAGDHAFAMLGIEIDAGKREIRRAFGELSRRFHPDALQARGLAHLRERVSRVFAALSEAQSTLLDAEKREQLRTAVQHGVNTQAGADATAMARAAVESDLLAREGDKLLRANRFDRALDQYSRALQLTPDEPDLKAAAIWCGYWLSPRARHDAAAAERSLTVILKDAPNVARAHYFRGLLLKELGQNEPAIAALTRAHDYDPRLIDAERQARALRAMRSKKA